MTDRINEKIGNERMIVLGAGANRYDRRPNFGHVQQEVSWSYAAGPALISLCRNVWQIMCAVKPCQTVTERDPLQ